MGWSSGTDVFDAALNIFLKYVPEEEIDTAISDWYHAVSDMDWDCEDESDYYDLIQPILEKEENGEDL